jgi:hypothetical protein
VVGKVDFDRHRPKIGEEGERGVGRRPHFVATRSSRRLQVVEPIHYAKSGDAHIASGSIEERPPR